MKKNIILCVFILFISLSSANAITPDQALATLDEASSKAMLTRQDHIIVVESVNLLRETLKEIKIKESVKSNPVEVQKD
jgi:hypothetical protein